MPPVSLGRMPASRHEDKQHQQDQLGTEEQPDMPSPSKHVQQSLQLVVETWKPLRRIDIPPYLGGRFLETLNVTVSGLSFTTGKPLNGGEHFMELPPVENVDNFLSRVKPWNAPGNSARISIDRSLSNLWQARNVWYYFESLLRMNQDTRELGLISKTGWSLRE
jgi:hypothetical protein